MKNPRRYITADDVAARRPVHVVWELTLACDLKCQHCGSRAGNRRPRELSTDECFDLIQRLARLGARHVTLIGGEAYLRPDWLEIIRAIRAEGMDCTLQTGGRNLTEQRLDQAIEAGLQAVGVSIDGLARLHDRLRGVPGSFDRALAALRHVRARGLSASVNTQLTRPILPELRALWSLLLDEGVRAWQVQLTVAMGRAADHAELLIQPYELLELMPLLAELYQEGAPRGLLLQPGNNIGYFGPYESLWRASGDERIHWGGCKAGQTGIGIEADGTIKGCPSLPTTGYAGGNVRDVPLERSWLSAPELRSAGASAPWGFCGSCYYADVCRGGCTWTSHSLLGRPGNNPFCHHRALERARQGLRERVVQVSPAPGRSFDHGRFELILEPLAGADGSAGVGVPTLQVDRPVSRSPTRRRGVRPPALLPCRGCHRHVFEGETTCPHCGGDLSSLDAEHARKQDMAETAYARLRTLMRRRARCERAATNTSVLPSGRTDRR